jgi:hypothetical protein
VGIDYVRNASYIEFFDTPGLLNARNKCNSKVPPILFAAAGPTI